MRNLDSKSLRFIPAALGLVTCLLAYNAQAATSLYFDVNGTTTGSGVANNGTYTWDGSHWDASSGLAGAAVAWGAGDFARFTTAVAGYKVTVGSSFSMAGLYNTQSGATVTINQVSSGNLNVTTTGGTVYTSGSYSWNVQGFLCTGPVVINAPIVGNGGVEQSQSAALSLLGHNTYAGGTSLTGGQLLYYKYGDAFGTGPIRVGGSGNALINSGSAGVTIPNDVVFFTANYNINLAGGAPSGSTPGTIFNGNFVLPATGTTTLNTGGSPAGQVTRINGAISGTSALTIADNGTLILAGANSYNGATTVGDGVTTPTLKLGAANVIANSPSLIMNQGTLDPGGFHQAMGSTTLGLTATSTIDFAAGGTELDFANSSALTWTGILNLINYNPGTDILRFGTDASGLTPTQLGQIEANGVSGLAQIDALGYVVVPEPSTILLSLLGGLGLLWTARRRTA